MRKDDSQQTTGHRRRHCRGVALAVALAAIALDPSDAFAGTPQIVASLSAGEVTIGAPMSVTGAALEAGGGGAQVPLALQSDPFPYGGFATIAHTLSAADGSFAFPALQPLVNTRLRVVEEGATAASADLQAIVDPAVALNASNLGAGRTRLSARIAHDPHAAVGSVSARWFAAARGTRTFRLLAVTPTRELSAGVTYASATIDPPGKRFVYRVCLNPAWESSMGPPASHRVCPQHDFQVSPGAD